MLAPGAQAKQRPAAEQLKGFDPEPDLVRIYTHIVHGRTGEALQATDALIARAPNFRLAHLIRGDLLLARSRPINTLGAAPNAPEDRLRELREEARQRLEGYRNRPPAGKLPGYFFQLAPSQTRALVMDTRRSRLYLFENDGKQIRLAADYYVTQGRNGDFKEKEGDQGFTVYPATPSHVRPRRPTAAWCWPTRTWRAWRRSCQSVTHRWCSARTSSG